MIGACKQVADLGDVAIQKEGFSIVDTRVPAIATHLSLSPGLHCVTLASSRRGMFRNKKTYLDIAWDLGPDAWTLSESDDCLQRAFEMTIH